ncbi:unnamed protein product [Brassica oleracea]|uniref:(rape) hypothetical protein n=1 Tax=Brassica napus TaxID=3708 RepID=A0A816UCA5_BRANA|nr:unnamed protein product [Brassica napus]
MSWPLWSFKSTTERNSQHTRFYLNHGSGMFVLVNQFKQEFCKLYGMTVEPLLNIYSQAGLSALKTPYLSNSRVCTKEDPLSQESFGS